MRRFLAGSVALLVFATGTIHAAPAKRGVIARISSGEVEGVRESAGEGGQKAAVAAFLGIPYVAAPVDNLRWSPPQPVASWQGVRQAKGFAPSCPQSTNPPAGRPPWTPEYLIPGPTSEDCLYLNVWRPAKANAGKLPVLVWFHGGAFVEGSGSVPIYNGAALANRGIVVVTVNYRLGVLGFLAHPELSREQGGKSGNFALQDQVAALHWVKANIAAFGGDPGQVTIAGQSAGAGSVNSLTSSPQAKGLFARTITESGSAWYGNQSGGAFGNDFAKAEQQGDDFARWLGAPSLRALRAMPADEITQRATDFGQQFKTGFRMVSGGPFLPLLPGIAQATQGAFNDTPVLSGYNWDELSGMDAAYGTWGLAAFEQKRSDLFAPYKALAAKVYPAATDAQANQMGMDMFRHRSRSGIDQWAKRRAAVGKSPIYVYFFRHPVPGPTQARYGTFHSSEIPYVFGNLNAPRPFTTDDHKVSDAMMTRWVGFIKGGSPNGQGLADWPAFDPRNPKIMLLGDNEELAPSLPPAEGELYNLLFRSNNDRLAP